MRLKNKKGMTAMIDAMIFIVIIGIAVSAIFALTGDEPAANDASSISDSIFSAKLRTCDLVETDDSRLVSMPDMMAFYILTGEGDAANYIESILDSLMQRPHSYSLSICYSGNTIVIGDGLGDAVSSSVKEFTVTYGGTVTANLSLY
jgi:hypothetical protein